jgi:hypothetical protein
MGVSLGTLEPRQVERLRGELAEALTAYYAYPPFFDYRAGESRFRPVDREKQQEIAQYLSSVTFEALDRVDVRSPEVRRFLERLFSRYIEINPALARAFFARRLPELKATVPRVAAGIQRGLVELTEGRAPAFGQRQPSRSWTGIARRPAPLPEDEQAYHTDVLAATLARSHEPESAPFVVTPVDDSQSPFSDLASGAQSNLGAPEGFIDLHPTRPMPAVGNAASAVSGVHGAGAGQELPPDLYQLYGDYLTDMHPATNGGLSQPGPGPLPGNGSASAYPAQQSGAWQGASAQAAPSAPGVGPSPSAGTRQDEVIFAQLRYQVEAYVRRAARSYGLPAREGDPARVLDALRLSGLVDEADLRIAESILALTDRVATQGHASIEDYRQAFMLYLLYHRSHLGE